MTFGALATLFVAIAFSGLVYWVMRPANKSRLESYGSIPFDDQSHSGR